MFDSELMEKATLLVRKDFTAEKRVPQHVYLIEEMSELIKEVSKDQRHKGNPDNIKEEIADVLCTILTYSSSIDLDFDDVRNIMIKKFDRGIARLDKGEQ